MGSGKNNFFVDCIGSISILTEDRVVFQGQIVREREEDRKEYYQPQVNNEIEFIMLELICDAAIIRDNGQLRTIDPPLFRAGDIVRINTENISAVGPSRSCPDDDDDDDDD